jgi:hypothetical protein
MCGHGSPTPLLVAIAGYEEDLVDLLLGAGADPNMATVAFHFARVQPLTLAVAADHTGIVHMLLEAGADPNAAAEADGARFTALDMALSAERSEIAGMLRARDAVAPAPPAASDDVMPGESATADGLPRDFQSAFAACTAGSRFDVANPVLGASVRYEIAGPEDGGCRVSLIYLSNPNPAWVGVPLLLTLDSRQGFTGEIEAGMRSCMSRGESRFRCAGPLLKLLMPDDVAHSVRRS